MTFTVLGAGSWGTALTLILARRGHEVRLLGRDDEGMASLRLCRENLRYLPGFVLPDSATFGNIEEEQPESDIVVVAVPSGAVQSILPKLEGAKRVVIASKGLDASGRTLSSIVAEAHPECRVAVLSGPNLSTELAQGIPTASVAASACEETAMMVREAFMGPSLRIYITDDVRGVELAGALKNVMALGAGMSDGLGFGDNTKAALLARGLSEIARLGVAMGARLETFLGIAGVGDLFATASSSLSRNYRAGRGLGEGRKLEDVLQELGQVAEGVTTCDAALQLAEQLDIEVRITESIHHVIHGEMTAREAVSRLMDRATLHEGLGYTFGGGNEE